MKTVYVMPELCIGCKHCEVACSVEHSESKNLFAAIFEKSLPTPRIHVMPSIGLMTYPGKCRQCYPAPCINVCPSGALSRDKETESILLNEQKCIACGMCAIACPLDAITFHSSWKVSLDREIAVKCDNCQERIIKGLNPACVDACKTMALNYGDINEIIKESRRTVAQKVAVIETEIRPEIPGLVRLWRDLGFSTMHVGVEK
ncbi:MAG: 4Fe-4S dicluster domain-containing protein [Promethearchaeota archaeon]